MTTLQKKGSFGGNFKFPQQKNSLHSLVFREGFRIWKRNKERKKKEKTPILDLSFMHLLSVLEDWSIWLLTRVNSMQRRKKDTCEKVKEVSIPSFSVDTFFLFVTLRSCACDLSFFASGIGLCWSYSSSDPSDSNTFWGVLNFTSACSCASWKRDEH